MTIPRAPSATTAPAKSLSVRSIERSSPSAVTSSSARTAEASEPLPTPEPCVPVEQAPATEMCGREPRLCRPSPAACTEPVNSAKRSPAETVTVEVCRSTSTVRGRPETETRSPVVSAMVLNECPLPSARTERLPATISCSSSTDEGVCTRAALKVMFPAQLVTAGTSVVGVVDAASSCGPNASGMSDRPVVPGTGCSFVRM